jgi:hypothetical protein
LRKHISIFLKVTELVLVGLISFILIRSALDIYNNFAYDKAIIKDSPYGFTPLLSNPRNYSNFEREILSGEYVYVVDWLSAYNGKVVFAKVKSRLVEGYINKDLLVAANINLKPIISIFFLMILFSCLVFKFYKRFAL